jgi:plastocyanin
VNKGTLTHTTTANNGSWDETLSPGETFTRKFRSTGTFAFHCSIHPSMTGTITVT